MDDFWATLTLFLIKMLLNFTNLRINIISRIRKIHYLQKRMKENFLFHIFLRRIQGIFLQKFCTNAS